ncbi:MAG: S46 family peptidase, partial [Candidatus Aminicenantes bacterium]
SPAPVYKDLEEAVLRFGLQLSLEALGPEDEFVQAALQGRTPAEVAREVIAGTKLNDPAFRKKLIEGGEEAVQKCQDPLIQLARRVDPLIRRNIKKSQDEIESVLVKAREKIAQARFAVYGKDAYPDATFTLRLAFGVVKGYPYNGTRAPYKTTLYGLFDRAVSFDNQGEFALPQRFWERKDKLDLSTPVNFVSTCDIIGGNSGSPVINRQGEVVGLIFDGNIESLSGRFMYDDTRARAVAVHTAYIIEGLRKLYDAGFLADEIEGKK